MKPVVSDLNITEAAIEWVESILKNRITSKINLIFNRNSLSYELRIEQHTKFFKMPLFKSFYKLGPQKEMPCGFWEPAAEKIDFFYDKVATPATKYIDKLISIEENIIYINYDIVGLIYWNYTRCEEIKTKNSYEDKYNRFESINSHARINKYVEHPIVDEWIYILKEIINIHTSSLRFIKKQFQFNLTHDVDLPSLFYSRPQNLIRMLAYEDFLKNKPLGDIYKYFKLFINGSNKLMSPHDPFNSFEWIMEQSESIGTKSSFYFIPNNLNKRYDGLYSIDDKPIIDLIDLINNRGHLIGIHPGFDTYNNQENFIQAVDKFYDFIRKRNINQIEWGGRMHYLRWIWPETSYLWSDSFLTYDSTLGYFDCPGFRCGTCHEFQMFDPVAQKRLNIIQRPLIVMDVSIMHYKNLDLSQEGLLLISDLIQRCKAVNGLFTLLWHNNYLFTANHRKFYRMILNQ